jgi:hypothetical protein
MPHGCSFAIIQALTLVGLPGESDAGRENRRSPTALPGDQGVSDGCADGDNTLGAVSEVEQLLQKPNQSREAR